VIHNQYGSSETGLIAGEIDDFLVEPGGRAHPPEL
jgi:hypothetical protein